MKVHPVGEQLADGYCRRPLPGIRWARPLWEMLSIKEVRDVMKGNNGSIRYPSPFGAALSGRQQRQDQVKEGRHGGRLGLNKVQTFRSLAAFPPL